MGRLSLFVHTSQKSLTLWTGLHSVMAEMYPLLGTKASTGFKVAYQRYCLPPAPFKPTPCLIWVEPAVPKRSGLWWHTELGFPLNTPYVTVPLCLCQTAVFAWKASLHFLYSPARVSSICSPSDSPDTIRGPHWNFCRSISQTSHCLVFVFWCFYSAKRLCGP